MQTAVIVLSISTSILLIALIIFAVKQKKKIIEIETKAKNDISALAVKHNVEIKDIEDKCALTISATLEDCSRQVGEMRDEVSAVKIDCERQIREARESIENRKDILSKMSDKELSIAIMLALDGYSDKLDRLENYLDHKQIKEAIQQVSAATIKSIETKGALIQESLGVVNNSITNGIEKNQRSVQSLIENIDSKTNIVTNKLDNFETNISNKIEKSKESITSKILEMNQSLSDRILNSVEFISNAINKMKDTLTYSINDYDLIRKINVLSERIETILSSLCDIDRQVSLLDSIKSDIEEIQSSITDEYDYNSLPYKVNEAISKIEDVKSEVDNIKSSVCDYYGYNTVASNISSIISELDNIKSEIDSCRSAAEDAKSAAEDAKYAAESISSSY